MSNPEEAIKNIKKRQLEEVKKQAISQVTPPTEPEQNPYNILTQEMNINEITGILRNMDQTLWLNHLLEFYREFQLDLPPEVINQLITLITKITIETLQIDQPQPEETHQIHMQINPEHFEEYEPEYCPNCQTELDIEDEICPNCGYELFEPEEEEPYEY